MRTRDVQQDLAVQPVDCVDGVGRQKHLLAEPPCAGADDKVADVSSVAVDQEVFDVADIAIGGMQAIPSDRLEAS